MKEIFREAGGKSAVIRLPNRAQARRALSEGVFEKKTYPYSGPGEAEALRKLECFHDLFPDDPKDRHISDNGIFHRVYFFDHVRFAANPSHRKMISCAAQKLVGLTGCNTNYARYRASGPQLEFWDTVSEFDAMVVSADVRITDGVYTVIADLTILLALEALLEKSKQDQDKNQNLLRENGRNGSGRESLPAAKPQLYFVDINTEKIFCFSDLDREAFFGDRPLFRILEDFQAGQQLVLVEASHGCVGGVVLLSMKIETRPEYMDCKTDLCLSTIGRIKRLVEETNASLIGIATYINLSGYLKFRGIEISSLVCRPKGTYTDRCPLCNPKQ